MELARTSGLLLHPTSLPGPFGIGDLGAEAYRFADFLAEAGQRIWQVLPLGPTGYADSPYQCFSAFAGNPLLISPQEMVQAGVLSHEDLTAAPVFPDERVDFAAVISWKRDLLRRAYETFRERATEAQRAGFDAFCRDHADWLDDFALFMALKEQHNYVSWVEWEKPLALRDPTAMDQARDDLADAIATCKFAQYQFFTQWDALRGYCRDRRISIVGDMPIYVAHDSADVWANRELFQLDKAGNPTVIGGVPPDYFSRTGQRWGNPLYHWDRLAASGYAWWVKRFRAALRLCDLVRIDHFRGFEAYWEVPARYQTAVKGRWVPGPREALFEALRQEFGDAGASARTLPIIAENLGIITPEVEALRERFGLPGMAVFQFGYGRDARSSGFPLHAYVRNLVAYTGTHDNDTLLGWWATMRRDRAFRDYVKRYLATNGREFNWVAIRALMASVANTVIFPLQDVLGLGHEGRMNRPGRPGGNWVWRYRAGSLTPELACRLRDLAETYGRIPD